MRPERATRVKPDHVPSIPALDPEVKLRRGPWGATVRATTLLNEDFEGAFPGDWSVLAGPGCGYVWDDVACTAHGGNWSVWAGDERVQPSCLDLNPCSPDFDGYADDTDTWLVWGPFNLSDVGPLDPATFSHWQWLDTEPGFDVLFWGVSVDGTNFWGTQASGNSGGYLRQVVDLHEIPGLGDVSGQSDVWIAFNFSSDFSITGAGAFVDDVVVEEEAGCVTLLDEAFEGVFPGSWSIEPGSGCGYMWGDVACTARSGNWSVWAGDDRVDSNCPDLNPCSPAFDGYANDTNTWLIRGPFDLSGVGPSDEATFSHWQWLDTESGFDFLFWGVSIDGANFWGFNRSGNIGEYVLETIDFHNVPVLGDVTGTAAVWIGFNFLSDSSITDTGAFVDDVRVSVCPSVSPCTAPGAPCDDGLFCTVNDLCDASLQCVGTQRVCPDDGNSCTDDACSESVRACENTPVPGRPCDDGLFCTESDLCNGGGQCSGPPRNCDDGDACTIDTCDDAIDACVHPPDPGCCNVSLTLDRVSGSCETENELTLSVQNDCDLAGIAMTVEDTPEWLVATGCDPSSALQASGFDCEFNDLGAAVRLIMVSLPGGLIPASPGTPQEVAEIRFQGHAPCSTDGTTVQLEIFEADAADAVGEPANAEPGRGSITLGTVDGCLPGDPTCDGTGCSLFDVLESIDQALNIDPPMCEADVDCNDSVNVFDVLCLIDCALGRPSCMDQPCTPGGALVTCPAAISAASVTARDAARETVGVSLRSSKADRGSRGGRNSATAVLHVENRAGPIRGLLATVRVPSGWVVEDARATSRAGPLAAHFHQDGGTLRLALVSMEGRAIPAGSGEVAEIRLRWGHHGRALRRPQELLLLAADVADELGSPLRVEISESSTTRGSGKGGP
jgi:hypothetical protein